MRFRRRHAVALLAFAVCPAVPPAAADAAVVNAIGSYASFDDRSFERNHVVVRPAAGGGLRISDRLAPIRVEGGCRRTRSPRTVVCKRAQRIEIRLGEGDDIAEEAVSRASIWGEGGDDTIIERRRRGAGADAGYLAGVVEEQHGNTGDDVIRAGDGADRVVGGAGSDTLEGGAGGDYLNGGLGNDDVWRDGDDRVTGGPGEDALVGGPGADVLSGGAGDDIVDAGPGDDILGGDAGDDDLRGGPEPLSVVGPMPESDADSLEGGPGDDRLDGAAGADRIAGGPGTDTLQYVGAPGVRVPPAVDVQFDGLANDGAPGEGDTVADLERLLTRPTIDLSAQGDPASAASFGGYRGEWVVDAEDPRDVTATVAVLGSAGTADAVGAQVSAGEFLLQAGSDETAVQLHGGDEGHPVEKSACDGTVDPPSVDEGHETDKHAQQRRAPSRPRPQAVPDATARAAWHAISRRLLIRLGTRRPRALASSAQPAAETMRVIGARAAAQLGPGDEVLVVDTPEATRVEVRSGAVEVEDCIRERRAEVRAGESYLARG